MLPPIPMSQKNTIRIAALLLAVMSGIACNALSRGGATATPTSEPTLALRATTPTRLPTKVIKQTPTEVVAPTPSFPVEIAYSLGSQSGVIRVVNDRGFAARDIVNDSCINSDPSWSPDGGTLVYQSNCKGSYDIWLVNSDGTGSRILIAETAFDEREAHFSPSGTELVYVRRGKGENYNTNGDIRIHDLTGTKDESTGLKGRGAIYSPDGTRLVYMSLVRRNWQLFVYDFASKDNQQITSGSEDARWPSWSPDGKSIVYNSAVSGGATPTGIWKIPADGGYPISLTPEGNYGRPSWSSNGQIVFNSTNGLWVVSEDGYDFYQLTSDNGLAPAFSR